MCWSQYEDRWAIEEEREQEAELRRLVADRAEPTGPRADAAEATPEPERELVEA